MRFYAVKDTLYTLHSQCQRRTPRWFFKSRRYTSSASRSSRTFQTLYRKLPKLKWRGPLKEQPQPHIWPTMVFKPPEKANRLGVTTSSPAQLSSVSWFTEPHDRIDSSRSFSPKLPCFSTVEVATQNSRRDNLKLLGKGIYCLLQILASAVRIPAKQKLLPVLQKDNAKFSIS